MTLGANSKKAIFDIMARLVRRTIQSLRATKGDVGLMFSSITVIQIPLGFFFGSVHDMPYRNGSLLPNRSKIFIVETTDSACCSVIEQIIEATLPCGEVFHHRLSPIIAL